MNKGSRGWTDRRAVRAAATTSLLRLATTALVAVALLALGATRAEAAVFDPVAVWGEMGTGQGQFNQPSGLATNAAGELFVADALNHRIQVFTSDGAFIRQWGGQGAGDGQLNYPRGVAVDAAGTVFVADTANYRIQKFSSAGAFLGKWGLQGQGDGEFGPADVAVDPTGNVYVSDGLNNRVQKFTADGAFLSKWGQCCTGPGEFVDPRGIAVDGAGNVYVGDDGSDYRVQKFTADGAFLSQWATGAWPLGLDTDAAGNVYLAGGSAGMRQFTPAGELIAAWAADGTEDEVYASGTAVDASGDVFVSDLTTHRIVKFTPGVPEPDPEPDEPVPPPTAGENVNVEPAKGKVKTRCKGEKKFTKLKAEEQIPLGCKVDTRKGRVTLTSADPDGNTQTASFYKGIFKVTQQADSAETELKLVGRLQCTKAGKGKRGKKGKGKRGGKRRLARAESSGRKRGKGKRGKKKGKGRGLWGKGKGKFKTKGKNGSATVRGTTWFVGDRCDGSTLFKVKEGTVEVRDEVKDRTIALNAGDRYVAKPKRAGRV